MRVSRQQRELVEMTQLAEKHIACVAATLTKSLDDIAQTNLSLKSFSKNVFKKDKILYPLIEDLKNRFYQCYIVDMKAYQKLYGELKVDESVDLENNVKKSIRSMQKDATKKFPNVFNDNRIKYDLIKHLGLDMNS
eukprot:NODE_953_length_2810_cov_0.269273.p3 type:complete len:136 gc:universal NODE_953_length_2810_cov_0.269273:2135-2542(+)